jgi:hypothetical protein
MSAESKTPSFDNDFVPATDEVFTRAWSAATGKTIRALGGEHIAGIDILELGEKIIAADVDLGDRASIETLAAAVECMTSPHYRPQLIAAAVTAAADRIFLSNYGPEALWRKEQRQRDVLT